MASGKSILPQTKISKPAKFKEMGRGIKHLPSRLLAVINEYNYSLLYPLISGFMALGYGETIPYITFWFKEYTTFWRTLSQPFRLLPPYSHCKCVFKMLLYLCIRLTASIGNMVRPVDSMILGPPSYFYGCEVSSLDRSNTVWNKWWCNGIL